MPFKAILKDLLDKVPEAIGAILIDWEGEAVVDQCRCDPYDIRFIAAHNGIILSHLKELQVRDLNEAVEDMVITTGKMHMIIGCINQDYSLVMNVERSCPVALPLHHFRRRLLN